MEGIVFGLALEGMNHVKSQEGVMLTKQFLDVCKLIIPGGSTFAHWSLKSLELPWHLSNLMLELSIFAISEMNKEDVSEATKDGVKDKIISVREDWSMLGIIRQRVAGKGNPAPMRHLVLGVISQIIKIQLLADLNLKKTPQLVEQVDDSKDVEEVDEPST